MSKPGRLYRDASHFSAIAMPTLVATPCPRGPVVVSTPEVQRYSGCPAQRLPDCRKVLRSSSVTEGRPRISYSGSTAFTLARCRTVYSIVEACPAERTKRSRFIQMGSAGSNLSSLCHRQYTVGDMPMGVPGWSEFACWIASMASVRIVVTQSASRSSLVSVIDITWPAFRSEPFGFPRLIATRARFYGSKLSLRGFSFLSTSCFCFRTPAANVRSGPFAAGRRAILLSLWPFKKSLQFGSRLEAIAEGATPRASALNVHLTGKHRHFLLSSPGTFPPSRSRRLSPNTGHGTRRCAPRAACWPEQKLLSP